MKRDGGELGMVAVRIRIESTLVSRSRQYRLTNQIENKW